MTTALLPPVLLKVKFSPDGSVGQVWSSFCVFQLFRALCFTGKIWGRPIVERMLGQGKATTVAEAGSGGGPPPPPPPNEPGPGGVPLPSTPSS